MTAIHGRNCIIADDVVIGQNTRLGNFVFIRSKTIIGHDCVVGSYVDIEGEAQIGNFVSMQAAATSRAESSWKTKCFLDRAS